VNRLRLTPEAELDPDEVYSWYQAQAPGLAVEESTCDRVQRPDAPPLWSGSGCCGRHGTFLWRPGTIGTVPWLHGASSIGGRKRHRRGEGTGRGRPCAGWSASISRVHTLVLATKALVTAPSAASLAPIAAHDSGATRRPENAGVNKFFGDCRCRWLEGW